jgi:putative ABC transport system ATP-binding protein
MFIEIQNLKKSYFNGSVETKVLIGLNMSRDEGEIGVILGPSGSGKSTLMNIIGGIDRADSGSVMVDGADICKFSDSELTNYRREELGFIFQFYNLCRI